MKLTKFEESYIKTMLWASTDYDSNPLDDNYDESDLSNEALLSVRNDCFNFLELIKDLDGIRDHDDIQIAHDFFLTRNGHGAGFWDGDYKKELGEKLTKICKELGSHDPYVGDDRKIHLY